MGQLFGVLVDRRTHAIFDDSQQGRMKRAWGWGKMVKVGRQRGVSELRTRPFSWTLLGVN